MSLARHLLPSLRRPCPSSHPFPSRLLSLATLTCPRRSYATTTNTLPPSYRSDSRQSDNELTAAAGGQGGGGGGGIIVQPRSNELAGREEEEEPPLNYEISNQMLFGLKERVGGERGDFVKIVECGPRDGLSLEINLTQQLRTLFLRNLVTIGFKTVEGGAFLNARYTPQMEGTDMVIRNFENFDPDVHLPVLVTSMDSFRRLLKAIQYDEHLEVDTKEGRTICDEITIQVGCTESYSIASLASPIRPHIEMNREIVKAALSYGFRVRANLHMVVECPFEGPVPPERVADIAQELVEMGVYEVSLGDTTGRGDPATIRRLIEAVAPRIGVERIAGHFHDTFGMALPNVLTALSLGVRTFESAVGGLGTCPYSPGAAGNMATEDLVYSLHNLGYHTGINVLELARTGGWICERLRRENGSRAGSAILARIAWEEDEEIKRSRRERSREWREVIKLKNYGFLVIAGGVGAVLAAWQAKEFYQSTEFAQLRLGQRMADQAIKNTMRDLDKEMDARASSQPREDKEV